MSSPSSFHTTKSTISRGSEGNSDGNTSQPPPYRSAVSLSEELRKQCHIYLDEQLYTSAFTLLSSLLTSGASHPDSLAKPALVPPPRYIEIVSGLLVHPRYTTQAPPKESQEIASRSIAYLRNLLAIVGPLNANFSEAFSLESHTRSRSARRNRSHSDIDGGSSESDSDDERIRGVVANKGRIRSCALDFWHLVGWAFNCSVGYPKRWRYWKVWLEYMLDTLEADWNEREQRDKNDDAFKLRLEEDQNAECDFKMLRKSLLVTYLSGAKGRSSAVKRIVKAAFADGGPDDSRAYPEIFENETREVKVLAGQKRKRDDRVAILEERYGEYDEDEAEDVSFDCSQFEDENTETTSDVDCSVPVLGGPDSIALRQRVLTLLSRVSAAFPESFAKLRDVYDIYCECIKRLPISAFSQFTSPSLLSPFPAEIIVSLNQLLLLRLLPNTAPRPQSISREEDDSLSQDVLEKSFLPFSANTSSAEDNAKVSLLVESLFRLFLRSCQVDYTPSLCAALEKGILSRESKIKSDKRKKANAVSRKEEENDRFWLKTSGEHLRKLLSWAEQKNLAHED